jgi:hypothetical protein
MAYRRDFIPDDTNGHTLSDQVKHLGRTIIKAPYKDYKIELIVRNDKPGEQPGWLIFCKTP